MKHRQEQLFDLVFRNLMSLPAYKLKNQYQKIFEQYIRTEFRKAIRKQEVEEHSLISRNNRINQSIIDIYQKPNRLQMIWFSFLWLPNRDKQIFLFSIISFFISFLVRNSNLWLILFGGVSLLIFQLSFTIFGIRFGTFYSFVEGTFYQIDIIFDKIKDYVFNLRNIDDNNLNIEADEIIKNIIEDDMLSLDYDWKKINVFIIVFASVISFLVVYISGDSLVIAIQYIANMLNFGDFELIKNLDSEKLATFILFPIGLALGKDTFMAGLKQRHKRLKQSLDIIENCIAEHNLDSKQH
ncbi:MAG: hypothetical protein QNJ37_05045 [Crocosphaera sp.]|nr:hypothetical protein [Crocosphaera sp.]MDJ0728489.1 hypothetical protein [Crocosphaera sp.]